MATAVITWGRMNPPTAGHEKLVNKLRKASRFHGGKPFVFLTKTFKKPKDPLPYRDKVKLAKKAFGNIVKDHKGKTLIDLMKELEKKYDDLYVVVGSDRVSEFETLLNKYNGKDYTFSSITILSAGERDPDAEGVSGISASKMRKFAADDDYDSFAKGLPSLIRGSTAKKAFDLVRKNL
jgi:nicotinic acid mononucleotide adenylyltransferase